jgi:hypothetical protein
MQQRRPAFAVHRSPLNFQLFTFQMRCDPDLNSSLMMADEKFHHSVYVILLDPVTLGFSINFSIESKPAPSETVRLCWHNRFTRRTAF